MKLFCQMINMIITLPFPYYSDCCYITNSPLSLVGIVLIIIPFALQVDSTGDSSQRSVSRRPMFGAAVKCGYSLYITMLAPQAVNSGSICQKVEKC